MLSRSLEASLTLKMTVNQIIPECIFSSPVSDLSKLSVCQLVDGDLTIAVGATGTVSSNLTEVKGNVRLGELTDNQLHFLRGTNVTGKICK